MTPEQIERIERSFRLVAPIAEPAAVLFYQRLFELDPALKPLFAHADMASQGRKLMAAIGFVVGNLRQPDAMLGAVRELGRRHAGYGVQPAHYGTVGAALLWTLEQGLGPSFTAEVREAWAAAYGLLAGAMTEAAAMKQAA